MTKAPITVQTQRSGLRLGLPVCGGVVVGASSIAETMRLLSVLGQSVFQPILLSDPQKIMVSLYLFLGLSALALGVAAGYAAWKGFAGGGVLMDGSSLALSLLSLVVFPAYGLESSVMSLTLTGLGIILLLVAGVVLWRAPQKVSARGPTLRSIEVATVAVFSALYAVMILFTYQVYPVPSPTGGFLHFGDFVVFVAALLFGYRVGGLVGVAGALVVDFYLGYPRWYVTILAHGLEGVIPGLTSKRGVPLQIVACVIGGFLMASTYFFVNIFIKGYPVAVISYAQDLFGQAGISIVIGLLITRVVKRALPQLRRA